MDCPYNCRICDLWGYDRCPQKVEEGIDPNSPYYEELVSLKLAVEANKKLKGVRK